MPAKEIKHSITAMADFYGLNLYEIMHDNNLNIKNSFWLHCRKI